ncbi:hypothetical protein J4404_01265 [Candidatus Woesearchaeota archaeon]|nr:hypothetical protein [Candidatus Woesearchaeota archaeon]
MAKIIVGIIPDNNENKIKKGIKLYRDLVPECDFSMIDYHNLLIKVAQNQNIFDIILTYKIFENTHNNICVAAYETRLKYNTLFLIAFNPIERELHNRNIEMEKMYLNTLLKSDMQGIVLTSSTEESFLLNIMRDMIDGKELYLNRKYKVESQKDFLVHDPGNTQIGFN